MSSIEMKSQIQEYLEQVDDSLVQAVHAMLGTYIAKQNDIVGYDIEGRPK